MVKDGENENMQQSYPKFSFLPSSFQYSSSLNGIIAVDGAKIEILDLHLGQLCLQDQLIQKPSEEDGDLKGICKFLEEEDKLVVACGNKVGCRSTNGGEHIFLSTILQVAEVPKNGKVTIELDIVKTGLLLNGLERCLKEISQSTTSTKSKGYLQDVITSLKNLYESAVMKMKDSFCPDVKWTTINLTMDHEMLLNVFNMVLLMSKQKREPELPIIGDILQRLTCLEKMKFDSLSSEKRLMFNEVDRLQTFNLWPHMNYKWALPGPMSEAGFYHPHSTAKGTAGVDRVMCFTCSVCLVSWESSDQPWSEHKRHSPNCPFIKGDYTENVPLNVYASTAYAEELSRSSDKIICMSKSSCNGLIAAGTQEGYIVIFETYPMLKIHSEYQITVSAMKNSGENAPPTTTSKSEELTENIAQEEEKSVNRLSDLALQASEGSKKEDTNNLNDTFSPNSTLDGSLEKTLESPINNLSEVDINGEKYCMISSETLKESKVEPIQPIKESVNNQMVENANQKEIPEVSKSAKESDNLQTDANERKSKSRTVERNCKITSVVILNDNSEKYIISGVKIESKKSRKNKTKQKFKLALLLYKIASFNKVATSKDAMHTTTSYPISNPPNVYPFFGGNDMEDFLGGSDDDFILDDAEANQLAVIDEYLMASQKNPSAHGGTQNIALGGSEIKTGFDQEEVIKKDSQFTIYEDCVFYKYDVDRNLFNSNMSIQDLFVVESYVVALLQNEHKQKNNLGDTLLVLKIDSKNKTSISVELVMKYTFPSNIYIKDALQVPTKSLSANFLKSLKVLDEFETKRNDDTDVDNKTVPEFPKTLLLFALSDKTFMFLSIPQMSGIKILSNCENDIHKIAFCSAISAIATCDVQGNFSLCHYSVSKESMSDTSFQDVVANPVNQWKGPFSDKDLQLLSDLTKFESATQSCYVFIPVNWCVTRPNGTSSSSIKSDSSMKHLLRLSPVQMDKKLIKRNEQLDVKLSKDDFTFKMFILVQSTIGYIEMFVNLKSPLRDDEDFSCSIYTDETQTDDEAKTNQKEKLLHGPVLFSSVFDESKSNGRFLIFIPKLMHHKSTYVVVKLQQINKIVTTWNQSTPKPTLKPKSEFLISDVLKDVYIGVHQYKVLPPNNFYFPGCRDVLLNDKDFQSTIVMELIQEIKNSINFFHENSTVKQIINILVWITSVYLSIQNKHQSFPLMDVIEENIAVFMKSCLMFGDRAICHACVQILLGLKKLNTSKTFESSLHRGLWEIIPHIHNAFSSAAIHLVFLLLCNIMEKSIDESDIKKLLKLLSEASESYASKFTETHKLLITRYGLSKMIMENSLVDFIQMAIQPVGNSTSDGQKKKVPQTFLSSHVPGLLEVQPLYFKCVSVSEGSKIESGKKKMTNAQNNKLKYGAYGFIPDPSQSSFAGSSMNLPDSVNTQGLIEQLQSQDDSDDSMYDAAKGYLLVPPPPLPPISNSQVVYVQGDTHEKVTVLGALKDMSSTLDLPFQHNKTSLFRNLKIQVEKMHVASVHYAVIEFLQTVQITDIIFPMAKSLTSISIFAWQRHETQDDAKLIAYSSEISKKILILSNLIKPVTVDFLKVLIVGGESCSPVISMGQYYGHIKEEVDNPSSCMYKYKELFEEEFCQYILGVDRISNFSVKRESPTKLTYASIKKDYIECRQHYESLSVCQNNVAWRFLEIMERTHTYQKFEDKSFNIQELCIYNILQALMKCCVGETQSSDIISKNEFVGLFNDLCIYGLQTITTTALSVLSKITSKCTWWSEALVEIFIASYGSDMEIKPRKRLFNIYLKMVQSSSDINSVVEKFLELLCNQIKSLLEPSETYTYSITMLDWLFLLLVNVLEQTDWNDWNFLLPWEHMTTTSNEQSDNPLNNPSAGAKKKKTLGQIIEDVMTENGIGSNQHVSGDSQSKSLKKHPKHSHASHKKKNEVSQTVFIDVKNLKTSNITPQTNLKMSSFVFINKEAIVQSVGLLLKYLVSKKGEQNYEQLILLCKLVTLLLSTAKSFITIDETITSEDLQQLLHIMMNNQNKWFETALKVLFKHLITHKDYVMTNNIEQNLKLSNDNSTAVLPGSEDVLMLGKKFFQVTANSGIDSQFPSKNISVLYPHAESTEEILDDTEDLINTDVVHPTRHQFASVLEDISNKALKNILSLQESTQTHTLQMQTINIEDSAVFIEELKLLKTKNVVLILEQFKSFFEQIELTDENIIATSNMVIFFIKLVKQNDIILPEHLIGFLCDVFRTLHKSLQDNIGMSFNVNIFDILEKLYEKLLTITPDTSLHMSLITYFASDATIPSNSISLKYVLLSLESILSAEKSGKIISIEEVTTMKVLVQHLLKTRLRSKHFGEQEKLFGDLANCSSFYSYGNVANTSADTILLLLENILTFVKFFVNSMQVSTGEKFLTKQTVFVINKGCSRLGGKAHRHDNDLKEALHLITIASKMLIIAGNIEDDSDAAREIYRKILQCFHHSYDLMSAKAQRMSQLGLTKFKGSADEISSSYMHPLLSALVLLFYNPSFEVTLPKTIIHSLIETMQQCASKENPRRVESLKILLAQVISHQEKNALSDVLFKDGLPLIIGKIISMGFNDLSYTDFLKHSHAIQELYSSRLSANNKRLSETDRIKKDIDGVILQNFAPYGKIIGPPSSASPEVLLLNKSPLRRVRFAAWGHHFQENDDPWITLEILLPFEIMLREANIHMHSANLIGSPSEVQMLLKSIDDEWLKVTPVLTSGVMNAIHMHLAYDCVCKEIMFRLKRPNGSEHIKLNLIELYGRDIYSSPTTENQVVLSRSLNCNMNAVWIDMFTLLTSENKQALQYLNNIDDEKLGLLMSSIIVRLPYFSRVTVHQFTVVLFNTLLPNISKLSWVIIKEVTTLLSSQNFLNNLRSTPIPLFGKIIFEVMLEGEKESQEKSVTYLLNWMTSCLQSLDHTNSLIEDMIRFSIQGIFVPLKNHAVITKDTIAIPENLINLLQRILLEDDGAQRIRYAIARFLNFLTSINSQIGMWYVDEAKLVFVNRERKALDKYEIRKVLSAICCYDINNAELIESLQEIIDSVCGLLHELLTVRDNKANPNILDSESISIIESSFRLFEYIGKVDNEVALWFISTHNKSFWKPLLEILCTTLPYYPSNNAAIFPIQLETISLFRKFLHLNPENQRMFSLILIDILNQAKATESTQHMNGFAKFLLLQLIISEDNAEVHYESKQASNFLKTQTKVLMPVTSSLSLLEDRIRSLVNNLQKDASSDENKEQPKEKVDVDSFDNMPFHLFETSKAAIAKRMPKQKQTQSSSTTSKGFSLKETDIEFFIPKLSNKPWPKSITVGHILQLLYEKDEKFVGSPLVIEYEITYKKNEWKATDGTHNTLPPIEHMPFNPNESKEFPTSLHVFAELGGLSLLTNFMKTESKDICLKLFGLVLSLPGFAKTFLSDRLKAEMLLRLMLGIKETKRGNLISSLKIAGELPTLPFVSLCTLLQRTPINTNEGLELRHQIAERNVIAVVLESLQKKKRMSEKNDELSNTERILPPTISPQPNMMSISTYPPPTLAQQQQQGQQNYWEKGTGFGTGSTASSWSIEKSMKEKKKEEEQFVIIFQILSAFMEVKEAQDMRENVENVLKYVVNTIKNSVLPELVMNYLRNDSVLDLARHIPLYQSLLSLLKAMATSKYTICLLTDTNQKSSDTLYILLTRLKDLVQTYQKKLKLPKKSSDRREKLEKQKSRLRDISKNETTGTEQVEPTEKETEELNLLLAFINIVYEYISLKVQEYEAENKMELDEPSNTHVEEVPEVGQATKEEIYCKEMKEMQFDTYTIIEDNDDGTIKFNVPFHFANTIRSAIKNAEVGNAARARRLAQEVASLSSSLPLSYSSTVFLHCDEERLDVMKVLITGPEDTPYDNGCFEFDVYFPTNYPQSPMSVHLQTTGRNTVRFNPNLYNDGKVCLSILNTWHGRPEERWNAQTSNMLQVLVSIQSLILVADPYFNEPGYERLRGTSQGKQNSADYNANIRQATVKWAMLEQIRRPSGCFKEIIQKHFLLKKTVILTQVQKWLVEMEEQSTKRKSAMHSFKALKTHFAELKHEFAKLEKAHANNTKDEAFPMTATQDESVRDISVNGPQLVTPNNIGNLPSHFYT